MDEKIDFVIAWVDGSDINWQKDKEKYTGIKADIDICRYRDWDLLRYWFRGVEKFAPWVNKIHFVTYGHLPEWLNTNHPKLNIVKHEDFIPKQYLPTFNSHTIELNFHRIKDLAEKFVYFNDDMFIINAVVKNDFFENNFPKDTLGLEALRFDSRSIAFIDANNISIINDYFSKREFVRKNFINLFNPMIGLNKVLKNILLMPFPYFTGFYNHHIASSFLKSTYEFIWENYYNILNETCKCKVREHSNVNQWLVKDVQLVRQIFKNRSYKFGIRINLNKYNLDICCKYIEKQKFKIICINDNEDLKNFNEIKKQVTKSFYKILSEKSLYEV